MTKYERARLQLRLRMETEISQLDAARSTMGESSYWKAFKDIQENYARQVADVDAAERSLRTFQQAKETGVEHDRPEQRYVDVMGQLKAQKITELVSKLAEVSSDKHVDNLSLNDPFYQDKTDPIGTFERWWNEEMVSFPSYDQMQQFLSRVDIDSYGFLIYRDETINCSNTTEDTASLDSDDASLEELSLAEIILGEEFTKRDTTKEMDLSEYQGLIRESAFTTARKRAMERKAAREAKQRRATPLLANTDHTKKVEATKKKTARVRQAISRLSDIVYSYDLDPDLEDLLIEHIEMVCVPCGMFKEDQYRPMLEQFLRYVEDPQKKKKGCTRFH